MFYIQQLYSESSLVTLRRGTCSITNVIRLSFTWRRFPSHQQDISDQSSDSSSILIWFGITGSRQTLVSADCVIRGRRLEQHISAGLVLFRVNYSLWCTQCNSVVRTVCLCLLTSALAKYMLQIKKLWIKGPLAIFNLISFHPLLCFLDTTNTVSSL